MLVEVARSLLPQVPCLAPAPSTGWREMVAAQGHTHWQVTAQQCQPLHRGPPQAVDAHCGRSIRLHQAIYTVHSPLRADKWEISLATHPDLLLRRYIVEGIRHGFQVGFNNVTSPITSLHKCNLCWLIMWEVCFVDWNNHLVPVLS